MFRQWCLIAVFLLLVNSVAIRAATIELTAQFTPSMLNPNNNTFINTTPKGGYCTHWSCNEAQYSVLLPLTTQMTKTIPAAGTQRDGPYFGLPKTKRVITVTNMESGESFKAEFRVSFFSAQGQGPTEKNWLSNTGQSATGNFMYPTDSGKGCSYGGKLYFNPNWFYFMWKALNNTTPCYKLSAIVRENSPSYFHDMSIGYELTAQSLISAVGSGIYTGHLQLSVGPGGDFDFGDNYQANDSSLTINLTMKVNHDLLVTTTAADRKLTLQPCDVGKICTQEQGERNWERWMITRITPQLTTRSQFRLSSSGNFTVYLQCGYQVGENCALKSDSNAQLVPLHAYLSLPSHIVDQQTKASVSHRPLSISKNISRDTFISKHYATNGAGSIDFLVKQRDVDTMLETRPDIYRGIVTVIFDPTIY